MLWLRFNSALIALWLAALVVLFLMGLPFVLTGR